VKGGFFVPMLEAIRRIVGARMSNPLLVVPVAKVEVEPTMPALHLAAPSVAKVFGEKLKVDGRIDEVSPFFSLAESAYRGYWTDAKEYLGLLMENVTERLRPILEEEEPEPLRAVGRTGKALLDRLSARVVSRYWVERTLRELAEALDRAYCKAFEIVKKEGKAAQGSSKGGGEDPYLDYIEELKRYEVSTFHSLRAHRYMDMIKALPDFEPVPYYTYDVEPETLREALGWIDRESFRNLLAHRIIYKDNIWRIKEKLTLPEFTVLKYIADKHGITVEIIEEGR